jgi:hypothetical protein
MAENLIVGIFIFGFILMIIECKDLPKHKNGKL